ncbi:MAG: class I SAM-dependent methyltransferase [Dehalococcoidia bacterium]|jgi:SAM-dependent methyltransferase
MTDEPKLSSRDDYDRLWSDCWGGMQAIGPVHRHVCRIIVEMVRPLGIRSVLDAGCGSGVNLRALQKNLGVSDVVGIDISLNALQLAATQVQGEFVVMDVERNSLQREFDLVLSSQVVEHLEDDEAFLSNLRAMCKGYCLIGTMQGRMRASEAYVGHKRNYTRPGLEQKLRNAGFAIERVVQWGFPFYSPLYRSAIELVGGQAVKVGYDKKQRFVASLLYQLYRLNSSRRGDVLIILGSVRQ